MRGQSAVSHRLFQWFAVCVALAGCAGPTQPPQDAGRDVAFVEDAQRDAAHNSDAPSDAGDAPSDAGDAPSDAGDAPSDAGDAQVPCANPDRDGDGHRAIACGGDDCDDDNAARFPERPESCNAVDDNCDGATDEGVRVDSYPDDDGDGFGAMTAPVSACTVPAGRVANHDDCNDTPGTGAAIHPGATDACDAARVDEDCDGSSNEGCACVVGGAAMTCGSTLPGCTQGTQTCVMDASGSHLGPCSVTNTPVSCYVDADGDGFAAMTATNSQACVCPAGTTATAPTSLATTDCNDTPTSGAAVNPGATPNCAATPAVDRNCNGALDNTEWTPCNTAQDPAHPTFMGCTGRRCAGAGTCTVTASDAAYRHDTDGDGACAPADDQFCAGYPLGPEWKLRSLCRVGADDCNDNDARRTPGRAETADGRDNNCNATCDEGFFTHVYQLRNPSDPNDTLASVVPNEGGWTIIDEWDLYNAVNLATQSTASATLVRCLTPIGRHYLAIGAINCTAPNVVEATYGYFLSGSRLPPGSRRLLGCYSYPGGVYAEYGAVSCRSGEQSNLFFGYAAPNLCWDP